MWPLVLRRFSPLPADARSSPHLSDDRIRPGTRESQVPESTCVQPFSIVQCVVHPERYLLLKARRVAKILAQSRIQIIDDIILGVSGIAC